MLAGWRMEATRLSWPCKSQPAATPLWVTPHCDTATEPLLLFPPNLALKPSLDSFPSFSHTLLSPYQWLRLGGSNSRSCAEPSRGRLCSFGASLPGCLLPMRPCWRNACCFAIWDCSRLFIFFCRILLAQPQGWHLAHALLTRSAALLSPYFHNIHVCWLPLCCLLSS